LLVDEEMTTSEPMTFEEMTTSEPMTFEEMTIALYRYPSEAMMISEETMSS
jgi:hypothetical protein